MRILEIVRNGAGCAAFCLVLALPVSAVAQSPPDVEGLRLEQNFPNPFTPGVSPTIFTYRLDATAHVRLTVYNLLAQEVAVLVDRVETGGLHRVAWDGADSNGERVPAGVYWYKLQAGKQTALRRLLVQTEAAAGG
ncbi:hypothetical protein BH18GEM1_BH18GEM1_05030 [soil metagenome]